MAVVLAMLFLLLGPPQEDHYSRLSKECGLEEADSMMRREKYLEAAVAYRNLLLESQGRNGIRIPLAFALLATGDVDYAGKQIRCARLLFDGFDRFRFDPATLFSSSTTWHDLLRRADARVMTPDGWIFLAYARFLAGEPAEAQKALAKYTRWRGPDDCAIGMDLLFRGVVVRKPEKAPAPLVPLEVVPKREIIAPGRPRSSRGTYLRSPMEMRKDQDVDRKK